MSSAAWFKMPDNVLRDGSLITRPNDALVLLVLMSRSQRSEGPVTYKGRQCWLKEGETCVSQNDISKWTGLTRNQIRTSIARLQNMRILHQANHQATTTEVPHYIIDLEQIQNPKSPSKSPIRHQVPTNRPRGLEAETTSESDTTVRVQTTESQPDTSIARSDDRAVSVRPHKNFDEFWALWKGNCKAVDKAKAAYAKIIKSGKASHDELCSAVPEYRSWCLRTDTSEKYPTTWLNGGCWKDDLDIPNRAQGNSNDRSNNRGIPTNDQFNDEMSRRIEQKEDIQRSRLENPECDADQAHGVGSRLKPYREAEPRRGDNGDGGSLLELRAVGH